MTLTDVIGTLAACLTTASFVPQAWLSFKTRDVSGVSLIMYSVFTAGVALWLAYGWLLGSWPMTIANTITLVLAMAILAMKLAYGRKPGRRTRRSRTNMVQERKRLQEKQGFSRPDVSGF